MTSPTVSLILESKVAESVLEAATLAAIRQVEPKLQTQFPKEWGIFQQWCDESYGSSDPSWGILAAFPPDEVLMQQTFNGLLCALVWLLEEFPETEATVLMEIAEETKKV